MLIPHEYVEGKNHGKREQGGTLWDFRVDAGGMEPQLEELRRRFYEYCRECHARLLDRFDAVRFRHFFVDGLRIVGDVSELAVSLEQERTAALEFLQAQYADIRQNFDPSIVPLRKKRKIVMTNEAWEDLS